MTSTLTDVQLARMIVLKHALSLELKGMKKRGNSVFGIVKSEFKLKGNKLSVYEQFVKLCEKAKSENRN